MLIDNCRIASMSFVSMYIQMMAKIETNGNEAKNAPVTELLLEISEIKTINAEEMSNFMI